MEIIFQYFSLSLFILCAFKSLSSMLMLWNLITEIGFIWKLWGRGRISMVLKMLLKIFGNFKDIFWKIFKVSEVFFLTHSKMYSRIIKKQTKMSSKSINFKQIFQLLQNFYPILSSIFCSISSSKTCHQFPISVLKHWHLNNFVENNLMKSSKYYYTLKILSTNSCFKNFLINQLNCKNFLIISNMDTCLYRHAYRLSKTTKTWEKSLCTKINWENNKIKISKA